MKLSELKLSDVGTFVRVGSAAHTHVQGRLEHVATETVEDCSLFQLPGEGDRVVTGYTLTVGGWTRNGLRPSTEAEFL